MPYTREQLHDQLRAVAIINHLKAWPWDGTEGPKAKDPEKAFWNELTEYCWAAYTKANQSTGLAYIGRLQDVKGVKAALCAMDTDKGHTLFNEGAKGNALEMNKWAPVLNDAWVVGHVHRFADFEVYSPRALANLWENSDRRTGLVVTARELSGLTTFGYERKTVTGKNVLYVCKNRVRATAADLVTYDRIAKEMEAAGIDSVMKHAGLRDDVQDQIRGFDKSKLRHF